jgi:hypothetical protein
MKRLYTLVAALVLFASIGFAQTICTVDPQALNGPGISPPPSEMPCVVIGENFNQIIQVENFSTVMNLVTVDSMVLDSIIGLPAGLDWIKSSNALRAGQHGCLTFFGTTNVAPGRYTLSWYGTVWASALGYSYPYSGNLSTIAAQAGGGNFSYSLTVINPGDPCPTVTGINDLSADLNSALYVYPNPNNGVFGFRLNAGQRVNGEIAVYDMTGKRVFAQPLDVIGMYTTSIDLSAFAKGLHTLKLSTASGFATRRISVE